LQQKNKMMIKNILLAGCIMALSLNGQAQYYYKDIVSNKQLLDELALLKEQNIKSVKITSFEDDGTPSEGFLVEKNINRNYTAIETFSRSNVTGPSLFTSRFTKDGLLIQTVDSSDLAVNTSNYFYDDKRRIKSIQSYIHSSDDDFKSEITEHHNYEYDANGRVSQMTQVSMSTANYIIWKYSYNAKGLKLQELGFDKEKKLIGRIEYSYE